MSALEQETQRKEAAENEVVGLKTLLIGLKADENKIAEVLEEKKKEQEEALEVLHAQLPVVFFSFFLCVRMIYFWRGAGSGD